MRVRAALSFAWRAVVASSVSRLSFSLASASARARRKIEQVVVDRLLVLGRRPERLGAEPRALGGDLAFGVVGLAAREVELPPRVLELAPLRLEQRPAIGRRRPVRLGRLALGARGALLEDPRR